MTEQEYGVIYNRFVENISSNYERFIHFDDVNFLLDTFEQIKLANGYVLDAYKVMDTYYREGEYFMQLYTCVKDSPYEYIPKLTNIRDTILKKLHLQKCKKEYLPVYKSSMFTATIKYTYWNEWQGLVKVTRYAYKFTETIMWDMKKHTEVIMKSNSDRRF